MKKKLFEMGANFEDSWQSDNKTPHNKISHNEIKPFSKHTLYFAKEKRRGKVVTIVKPFYLEDQQLKATIKELKKTLGTGGSIKDNSLEFQGDIKDKLLISLKKIGFGFKHV